jgi:hypothetical protein
MLSIHIYGSRKICPRKTRPRKICSWKVRPQGKFVHKENSSLENLSPRKICPRKIHPQGKFVPKTNCIIIGCIV